VKQSKFSFASLEDWWVLEVVALFLSAVLLSATAVLLRHYDDKPQPGWEMTSLNTLVAWMGTLSRALVLLPVSRSLGQLKWTWFATRPRSLADVQSFDDASRGVIGSTQLLLSRRGWCENRKNPGPPQDLLMTNTKLHRHLQSIGCFATIIAIGFGPSLQNLIHYYPNTVVNPAQQAYITNSSSYTSVGPLRGGSRETREIPLID